MVGAGKNALLFDIFEISLIFPTKFIYRKKNNEKGFSPKKKSKKNHDFFFGKFSANVVVP